MTTGDTAATDAALIEILAAHDEFKWTSEFGIRNEWVVCGCGETISPLFRIARGKGAENYHRAHVASVLAGWVRQQQAEAWAEGHRTPRRMTMDLTDGNPYADRDGEGTQHDRTDAHT